MLLATSGMMVSLPGFQPAGHTVERDKVHCNVSVTDIELCMEQEQSASVNTQEDKLIMQDHVFKLHLLTMSVYSDRKLHLK